MEKNAKIYVAGHRGLVGSAIVRNLQAAGYTNLLLRTHAELDLTNQRAGLLQETVVRCVRERARKMAEAEEELAREEEVDREGERRTQQRMGAFAGPRCLTATWLRRAR